MGWSKTFTFFLVSSRDHFIILLTIVLIFKFHVVSYSTIARDERPATIPSDCNKAKIIIFIAIVISIVIITIIIIIIIIIIATIDLVFETQYQI